MRFETLDASWHCHSAPWSSQPRATLGRAKQPPMCSPLKVEPFPSPRHRRRRLAIGSWSSGVTPSPAHSVNSIRARKTTASRFEPSIDYFVARHFSLGGALIFSYATSSNSNGSYHEFTSGIAPRIGYDIALSNHFRLWPKASIPLHGPERDGPEHRRDQRGQSRGRVVRAGPVSPRTARLHRVRAVRRGRLTLGRDLRSEADARRLARGLNRGAAEAETSTAEPGLAAATCDDFAPTLGRLCDTRPSMRLGAAAAATSHLRSRPHRRRPRRRTSSATAPARPRWAAPESPHSDGFEAAYTNPALLSRIRDAEADARLRGRRRSTSTPTAPGSRATVPYDSMRGMSSGSACPSRSAGCSRTASAPGSPSPRPPTSSCAADIPYPETPQFPLLPDRAQSLSVRAGLGVDVGLGHPRRAAGFAALAELDGSAVVADRRDGARRRRTSRTSSSRRTRRRSASRTTCPSSEPRTTTRVGGDVPRRRSPRTSTCTSTRRSSPPSNIPVLNIAGLAQYDPEQLALRDRARHQGPFLFAARRDLQALEPVPGLLEPTIPCPAERSDVRRARARRRSRTRHRRPARRRRVHAVAAPRRSRSTCARGRFYEPIAACRRTLPSSQAYDPPSQATVVAPDALLRRRPARDHARYGVALKRPLPPGHARLLRAGPRAHAADDDERRLELRAGARRSTASGKVGGTVLVAGLLAGVKF